MNDSYNIKIKNGNMEIEVSGSEKEFVTDNFKDILEKIGESDFFKIQEIELQSSQFVQPSIPQQTNMQTDESDVLDNSGQSKLAKAAGVSMDNLLNIYDFRGDEINIHATIKGNDAKKQKIIAKLALIANEYINGISELSGKALGKYMKESAIGSMANLAVNLKRERGIIKNKSNYRLNNIGKKESLELIKSIAAV